MDVVDDPTGILARIDAATVANLCGCGCGRQIPANSPSADFVNEKHQAVWSNAAAGTRPELPTWAPCDMPECDGSHRYNARATIVTIDVINRKKRSTLRRAIDRIRGITR